MNQVGQLENRIAELERTARDSRRAVDNIGNARLGNIASTFDNATNSIGKFRGGLQGVLSGQGGMGDLVTSFKSIPPQALLAAGSVIAITGAVAGLGFAIKSSLSSLVQQGDELDKASQRAGVSVEALQQLRYAAELSGIGADKLTNAFKEVNNALGQGKEGEKAKIFERMGVSITDATGKIKSADQMLIESADTFKNLSSDTERAVLAQKLFGEGGKELVPLLKQGTDAVREQMGELDELGGVLGGDTVKATVELSDQMTRIKTLMSGVSNSFAEIFLPSAKLVVDVFLEIAKAIKGSLPEGESFKDLVLSITKSGLRLMIQAIDATVKKINQFGSMLIVAAPLIENVYQHIMLVVDAAIILVNALDILKSFIQVAVITVVEGLVKAFGALVGAIGDVAATVGLDSVAEQASNAKSSIDAMSGAFASIRQSGLDSIKTDWEDINNAIKSTTDRVKNYGAATKNIQGVGQSLADLQSPTSGANDAIEGLVDAVNKNTEAQKEGNKGQVDLSKIIGKDKGGKGQKEKPERLTIPQQFEKLTGKAFPKELIKDQEALRRTEDFNKRRDEANKRALEQQNRINGSLQSYNKSLTTLDNKTKEQVAVAAAATVAAEQARSSKESVAINIELASHAEQENVDLSKQIAKDSKDISKTQKELEAAKRFNADQEKAAMIGFGGVGGGAGALGGRGLGKIAFDKSDEFAGFIIDKFVAAQAGAFGRLGNKIANSLISRGGNAIDASLKATRTAAGGVGATAGVATGGGVGKMIADWSGETRVKKLEAQEQKLNDKVAKNNELRQRNNEIIAEGNTSLELSLIHTEDAANASQERLDAEGRLLDIEKEKGAAQRGADAARAAGIGNVISLAQTLVGIGVEQAAVETELSVLAADVLEILRLRTEIANNELNLSEEDARLKNAGLLSQIKQLEIRRADVSEAERKVLVLEEEVELAMKLRDINNSAIEGAKAAVEKAREAAENLTHRNEIARQGYAIEEETNELKKAQLEFDLKAAQLLTQELTDQEYKLELLKLENELKEKRNELDKKQNEEQVKSVENIASGFSGAGQIAGGLGDLINKIGGPGKEDDMEFQDMLRQIDNVSGALGGLGQATSGVARIMSGDLIGGITSLITGLMSTVGSVYDFFFGETEQEKKDREEREKKEEESRFDDITQIFFDNAALRQQAEEFAKAFVSEQEKRMGRPVEITIDARGALIGEENEIARSLGNLLETELGRRVGNAGIGRF
jgi:hypothetical protein